MGGNAKDIGIGIATGGLVGAASYASDHGPSAPELPVDPNLAGQQERAKNDQIKALQTQVQSDSASLMARYGTRLALAGTQAPAAAPAPAAASSPDFSAFGFFAPFVGGALTQLGVKI